MVQLGRKIKPWLNYNILYIVELKWVTEIEGSKVMVAGALPGLSPDPEVLSLGTEQRAMITTLK